MVPGRGKPQDVRKGLQISNANLSKSHGPACDKRNKELVTVSSPTSNRPGFRFETLTQQEIISILDVNVFGEGGMLVVFGEGVAIMYIDQTFLDKRFFASASYVNINKVVFDRVVVAIAVFRLVIVKLHGT